ncbi:uncharacterized protein LOC103516174 [Diaphorina citri]|uniref:Uncharacterized protein LOC103516174 n=1 Tax=Diaphorina citri TaxID=121845 RepID=A0A3Q0J7J9_DIACI|nr:uncharacterized protein LOC103516174 [Diaphorina citri]
MSKNMENVEEFNKVLRVLNLWSLNDFFKDDVLKPIFELADKIEKKKQEEAEEREAGGGEEKKSDSENEEEEAGSKMITEVQGININSSGVPADLLIQLANLQSALDSQNIGDILTTMRDDNSNSTSLTKGIEFILSNPNLIKQLGELQTKFSLNQIKDLENIVESSLSSKSSPPPARPCTPPREPPSVEVESKKSHPSQLLAEESEFEKFLRENERSVSKRNRERHVDEVDLRSPEQDVDLRTQDSDLRAKDYDLRSIHLPHHNTSMGTRSNTSSSSADVTTSHISSKFNLDD